MRGQTESTVSAGGIGKMEKPLYRYRIRLDNVSDMTEFTKAAVRCPSDVYLVNGHHRLNAKSFLSVAFARISWDEITVETDFDCYFEFEKFIAK